MLFARAFVLCCALLGARGAVHDEAVSQWNQYRSLFDSKRRLQLEAIDNIVKLGDEGKQKKMIAMLTDKLFQVLSSERAKLLSSPYELGDSAPPQDEAVRESLSLVFENTLFFSDLMLRFPSIAHAHYDNNKDRVELFSWSVSFCNDSRVFAGTTVDTILNLVSQEVNLLPRDPAYKNPYAKVATSNKDVQTMASWQDELATKQATKKKTKKKAKSRGPKLSSPPPPSSRHGARVEL